MLEAGGVQHISLSHTVGLYESAVEQKGCSPKLKHTYFWDVIEGWSS